MKGKQKLRAFVCVCALGITGLLASLAPRLLHFSLSGISNMPPGARVAQRQLVTVWICGDLPGASAWVQKQAAAYGKRMPGVSVWLRTVTAGELDSLADTLPDVLTWDFVWEVSDAAMAKAEDGTFHSSFFDLVDELEKRFVYAKDHTSLPENPDAKAIEQLVMQLNRTMIQGRDTTFVPNPFFGEAVDQHGNSLRLLGR